MAGRAEIKQVKDTHKQEILSKPHVIGVGTGYKVSNGVRTGELCLVTLVRRKMPLAGLSPQEVVPKSLNGVPTDVIEIGDVRALQARTDRWRPAPGGVSIGHYRITAGTLGAVVHDRDTNERLILSNNHVMANSNDASIGDPILQPGPTDGGTTSSDVIANLLRFCPIQFSEEPGTCSIASSFAELGNTLASLLGSKHRVQAFRANPQAANLVDCAVARPVNDGDVLDEILEVGTVSGTVEAALGMAVRKSGRTTGFTTGEIIVLDATVSVSYGVGRTASFENQIVTGPISQGGDSGSLVVAGNELKAVGLLFAGSDQSTILNPIQAVLDCLNVTI